RRGVGRWSHARCGWSPLPWYWTRLSPRDAGDLDRRVVLTMTPPAPAVGLVLVREAPDLVALRLAHHAGSDRGLPELVGRADDRVAVDDEQGREGDLVALVLPQQLDVEPLALGHPLLLPTGPDHRVHDRARLQKRVIQH